MLLPGRPVEILRGDLEMINFFITLLTFITFILIRVQAFEHSRSLYMSAFTFCISLVNSIFKLGDYVERGD